MLARDNTTPKHRESSASGGAPFGPSCRDHNARLVDYLIERPEVRPQLNVNQRGHLRRRNRGDDRIKSTKRAIWTEYLDIRRVERDSTHRRLPMKRERPNPVLKPALQITDTVKPIG